MKAVNLSEMVEICKNKKNAMADGRIIVGNDDFYYFCDSKKKLSFR